MKYLITEFTATLTAQATLTAVIILGVNAIKYLIILYEKHMLRTNNKQIIFARQYLFPPSLFLAIAITVSLSNARIESGYCAKIRDFPAAALRAAGEVFRRGAPASSGLL